ncbi:hypothetical protein R75461_05293 [Paraburkholderia nemoris]|uniref:hypothetical protein n=1 Tax=Paraburkholderia nemoris TaxID=2793076 RepID=UPI00190D1E9B|nr:MULTISPECIES: hypothetical protein [Paraburkholderia]MBK3783949.1 hypothetical protein [Paraburkholderia aspalathi]CAE6803307.1 hypothetical protein R75461_05293 [Paraburkholderia nemoris]
MEESKEIQLESKHRFQINNLTVEFALMGKSHVFPYKDATVTITLPKAESIAEHPDEFYIAGTSSYRMEGEKKVLLTVNVGVVNVSVKPGESVALPSVVLGKNPIGAALIPEDVKPRLKEIGERTDDIASNAFEYWLTVMRWRCDNHRIGRPPLPGPNILWQNFLLDAESKQIVWSIAGQIRIVSHREVTTTGWADTQASLQACEEVPVYILLLNDAREYFLRHEYRRAIIDLAIACEVFMRTIVLRTLPKNLDADMRAMIEEANINQYRKKFLPNLLTKEGQVALKKLNEAHLNSLFDARNKIMHVAKDDRATNENCTRFIKATATLFEMEKNIANPSHDSGVTTL